jgi:predicted nuclease with TOPRIM domain
LVAPRVSSEAASACGLTDDLEAADFITAKVEALFRSEIQGLKDETNLLKATVRSLEDKTSHLEGMENRLNEKLSQLEEEVAVLRASNEELLREKELNGEPEIPCSQNRQLDVMKKISVKQTFLDFVEILRH